MAILNTLGIDPTFLVMQVVGFVLLTFILVKFAFGPIFGVLQQRQDHIRSNIDEAEARRAEMVRLQGEYEQRLAKIEDEARDKIQAAVKEAQAARDEIIAKAHSESAAILARNQEDLEREREQAMAGMRDQIAELAIAAATRVTRASLDGNAHSRLIDEVIGQIGNNGAAAGTGGGAR